jgi:hypothetical protein
MVSLPEFHLRIGHDIPCRKDWFETFRPGGVQAPEVWPAAQWPTGLPAEISPSRPPRVLGNL